jgi:hypothetical protein
MVFDVYNTNVLLNVLLVFLFLTMLIIIVGVNAFGFYFFDSVNHYSWGMMSSMP